MIFDYKFYVNHYEDLKNAEKKLSFIDGCNHFLNIGIEENRVFCEKLTNFDYKFYINYYQDLKEFSFIDACNHYIKYGNNEKRFCNNNLMLLNEFENNKKYNNDKINNYKFLHITKTGGTSIEEFALKLGIKWGKYDKIFYQNYNKEGFWHIPLNYFNLETINKYKWFVIVRNPYDRIISEINYLIKDKYIDSNINEYLHNILSNLLKDEQTLNSDFIEKNDIMLAFHFVPMYFYTCYGNKRNNSNGNGSNNKITDNIKVIKFENLNKEFNSFLKELSIEETFDIHENKSEKVYEFDDLSIKNIKLINKVYKKDFELFDYKIINY